MTAIPQIGMHRTEDHLYYFNGEGPFTSVTTALKLYDKSEVLVAWAKKETARFALANVDALITHRLHNYPVPECSPCAYNLMRKRPVGQQEAARMWVSSIPDYIKDAAADLGTRVHAVAEAIGRKEPYDTALEPYAQQYLRFLDENGVMLMELEYMGLNREVGYAGTGDLIAYVEDRGLHAIDIKTWTKPDEPIKDAYYPETAMQLAACSRFEFIGKPDDPNEYLMPSVDAYAVLLLGTEDYRLIPYAVTEDTFEAFRACLTLHRWRNGEAKTIVQPAISVPRRAA